MTNNWIVGAIALIGVMIAYFQWVTAHQKIALELFDRRFETIMKLRQAIIMALAHGDYGSKNSE